MNQIIINKKRIGCLSLCLMAIAVFISDSKADDGTREQVIAKVARAIWDQWSQ